MSTADLRKVKMLAQRLGARDSDIIRFALKTMLARLAPLCDDGVHGRALLPVFVESGSDLFHHFDLDTTRLEEIVNGGVSNAQKVEPEDLKLIAIARSQHPYAGMGDALSGRLRGYLNSKYDDKEPTSDATTE